MSGAAGGGEKTQSGVRTGAMNSANRVQTKAPQSKTPILHSHKRRSVESGPMQNKRLSNF